MLPPLVKLFIVYIPLALASLYIKFQLHQNPRVRITFATLYYGLALPIALANAAVFILGWLHFPTPYHL